MLVLTRGHFGRYAPSRAEVLPCALVSPTGFGVLPRVALAVDRLADPLPIRLAPCRLQVHVRSLVTMHTRIQFAVLGRRRFRRWLVRQEFTFVLLIDILILLTGVV